LNGIMMKILNKEVKNCGLADWRQDCADGFEPACRPADRQIFGPG